MKKNGPFFTANLFSRDYRIKRIFACLVCIMSVTFTCTAAVTAAIQGYNTCGATNNGGVSVFASGGTSPYTYHWANGGAGSTNVSSQTGSNITGLTPGTYLVTVTDHANLTASSSVTVVNTVSNLMVNHDTSICPGGSAHLTASGADIYTWSPATGLDNANVSNPVATPTGTTTYTVTGYKSTGNLVFNGDFSQGNVGFTSGYTYISPSANAASGGMGLEPEGDYAVDANAHAYHPVFWGHDHTTGHGNFMIVNGAPTANVVIWGQTVNNIIPNTTYFFSTWVSSMNLITNYADLVFSINGVQVGPTIVSPVDTGQWIQFFTQWNSGSNTSASISIVNQNVVRNGNDFGLDDITFTTECPATATVTVTVVPVPVADAGPDQTICSGRSATLTATGAGAGGSYHWSTGANTPSITVSPSSTTTYFVTATNATGCSATDNVQVILSSSVPSAACKNATVFLNANGQGTIAVSDIENGSSANCGVASVTVTPNTFNCSNVGPNTVTLTVTDSSGHASTCTATVTVLDTTAPVIICAPGVTVSADAGQCSSASVELAIPTASDNCGIPNVTSNKLAVYPVGTTTVTWTADDGHGNTATCTQTVTVTDNEPPSITCPADVNVNTDPGQCSASNVVLGNPRGSDNCGNVTFSNDAPAVYPLGTTTVTWTANDGHGNTATCTQTVTVTDNEKPFISCAAPVNVNTDAGQCSASNVSLGTPTGTDNCGNVTFSNDAPAVYSLGTTTVTWTANDGHGNTATCTQTVTVSDNEKPFISCAAPVNVNTDAGQCSASNVSLGTPTGTDNCGNVTFSNDAPAVYSLGTTTVTWTANDGHGNTATCTQTVTVTDNEKPFISCAAPVNVNTDAGQCSASNVSLGTPTGTDNCGNVTFSNDAPAVYSLGTTTVTWTANDGHGNTATCTQTVTVTDNEKPFISCAAPVNVNTDAGQCSASNVSLGTPTGTDNCGNVTFSNDAPAVYSLGTTTVTWTANDGHGNTATCTQTVTVSDTTKPTITCAAGVSVSTDPGLCSASNVSLGAPTGNDNCGNNVTFTNNAPPVFPLGITTVTWTANDGHGNTGTCTQTVTVTDNEIPIITCAPNVSVNTDPGQCSSSTIELSIPTVSDNCGIPTVTNNAPAIYPVGTTTVTWTANDGHGNTATCTQTVTVTDNEPPTITCPPAVNANTDAGQCSASNVNLGTPTGTDNCGNVTFTNNAPSIYPIGVTTVTWTANDGHGNTATCTQTVTVADHILPTAICKNITIALVGSSASITAANIDNGSFDNCGIVSRTISKSSFTCADLGTNNVTLTVYDAAGNSASCTATVTVIDNTPPTAMCKNVTLQLDASGHAALTAAQVDNGSTDNCTIASRTVSKTSFTCANIGANPVTLTVTDQSGNSSTCNAIVTVADNIAPTAICKSITVTLVNGTATITAANIDNGSFDNCGIAGESISKTTFTTANVGPNTVVLTVTDASGNVSTCTATVTVVNPAISCNVTASSTGCHAHGSVTLSVTSTGTAPFTYSWSPANLLSCSHCPNPVFTPSTPGNYTFNVTVTDAHGAHSTCSITINVTPPALSCNVTASNQHCNPHHSTTLSVHTTGGQAPFTYAWSPANQLSCSHCQNPVFTPSAPGNYTFNVTVTDAYGTTTTCDLTIHVAAPPLSCSVSASSQNCHSHGNTTLSVSTTGGQAPFTYSWSPANLLSCSHCQSPVFTPSAPGNYTFSVTVTDAYGTTTTCDITVHVSAPPITCNASANKATIYLGYGAQTSTLSVTSTGVGTLAYAWSPASNLSCSHCASPVFSPSTAGNYGYEVTVTDANGSTTKCDVNICVFDIRVSGCGNNNHSVYICHQTTGCHSGSQTITMDMSQVQAYLASNPADQLGKCGEVCGSAKEDDAVSQLVGNANGGFELLLYPNPFTSQFHLKIQSESSEIISLKMLDITGQLLGESINVQSGDNLLLGDKLARGMYFVEVKQGDLTKVIRIIKAE